METKMNVYTAIANVAEALAKSGVGKTSENRDQHYKFRGIDAIMNALSAQLVANKLIIIPRYTDRVATERVTSSGKSQVNVAVTGHFRVVCGEDGSSVDVGPFFGEGQDFSDKATNKAMSAAYKYMATQTFCIPFEGMDDGDEETPEETVAREPEREKTPEEIAVDTAQRLINTIKNAPTADAVDRIMHGSIKTLSRLRESYNGPKLKLYDHVQAARADRLAALDPPFPGGADEGYEIVP